MNFPVSGRGVLGTTAALILALVVIAIATQNAAAQTTGWIGVMIAILITVFALKVLSSRGGFGGLSFGR